MNKHKFLKIVGRAGGVSHLARELDVTRQAIYRWAEDGVPAERVPKLAKLLDVKREDLRPDVYGEAE